MNHVDNVCQQCEKITKSSVRPVKTENTVQWSRLKCVTTAASTGLEWHYKLNKPDNDRNMWHSIRERKKSTRSYVLIFIFSATPNWLLSCGAPVSKRTFWSFPLTLWESFSYRSTCGKHWHFQWFYQNSLDPLRAEAGSHVLSPACWRTSWQIAARHWVLSCSTTGMEVTVLHSDQRFDWAPSF